MSGIIIVLFAIFGIAIFFIQNGSHESSIKSQVEALGGTVISIERTMFNNGPFFLKGKGRTIYRFEYNTGGEIKEGWVRFGGLFGADWRL
jgi:hypothetical protein